MLRIDRRALLAALGALAAAPLAALSGACRRSGSVAARADDAAQAASQLAGDLAGDAGVAALGRLYLERFPAERDLAALVDAIRANWPEAQRREAETPAVRRMLRRQARADFAAGRTVELEGWVLSRTEARLSAIAELL